MTGQTVSHYRILEKLGEGGMGVVWKAEDTKLKRTVALKFVPPDAAGDNELCTRFRQEAQAAAALSHPNVCTVFEIDEECGFLAMEFVDGETAQARARQRPLPLPEALDIAIQAAQGLQAAHEKGVVHRDIKSANLMVTPSGAVKIMDFGLARLTGRTRVTRTGTAMGTPAYMSPEQAQGKAVDRRTDLWSLGVVLYELVTGQLPFRGESEAAVVHSLLHDDPEPVTALRAGLPLELDRVVGKALAKDPGERYQHAEDFLVDLRTLRGRLQLESKATRRAAALTRRRGLLAAALGTALFVAGVAVGIYLGASRKAVSEGALRKFQLQLGADLEVFNVFDSTSKPMLSPDGTKVAYVKQRRLWIWDLQQFAGREIPGTEEATGPFWSPDSGSVAFRAGRFLRRLNVENGSLTTVGEIPDPGGGHLGGSWSPSGSILIGVEAYGLLEVPAQGGAFKVVLAPDHSKGEYDFHSPQYLPDGRSFLFVRHVAGNFKHSLCVQSGGSTRCGLEGTGGVAASPVYDSRGYILYERIRGGKSVLAAPFDLRSLTVSGERFVVADGVGGPSVSRDGSLLYVSGRSMRGQELVMVDRAGRYEQTVSEMFDSIRKPAVSPDGTRVAMGGIRDGNVDIWVYDLERKTSVRVTSGAELDQYPAWSPGGDVLAFTSGPIWGQRLSRKRSDGGGNTDALAPAEQNARIAEWAPDGNQIVYSVRRPDLKWELWVADPSSGLPARPLPGAAGGAPAISPDGKFVAYESDESGRSEVYVVRYPAGEGRWVVSPRGGRNPRWNPRGGELFYLEGNSIMVLPVAATPRFQAGIPKELFNGGQAGLWLLSEGPGYSAYDVTPDGQHVVAVRHVGEPGPASVTLVENWLREFRK